VNEISPRHQSIRRHSDRLVDVASADPALWRRFHRGFPRFERDATLTLTEKFLTFTKKTRGIANAALRWEAEL
jgi:hypothetical protein